MQSRYYYDWETKAENDFASNITYLKTDAVPGA